MADLTDETVGEYLGMSAEQIRILRSHKETNFCAGCATIHPSFPTIRIYHSPCCPDQGKCRDCGADLNVPKGHQVGAVCWPCANGTDEPADEEE